MKVYDVIWGGILVLRFKANFAQASSPILIWGNQGWDSTPFQVADFRHRPIEAAKGLNSWLRSEGGEAWEKGEKVLTLRTWRTGRFKEGVKKWYS